MAGDHTGGLPELVYAQVSPRSVGGVSMFEAATITQDTAAGYVSEPELASRTAAQLSAAGFQVLQVAPQTVNVAAPPGLYEAFFQTRLLAEERPVYAHELPLPPRVRYWHLNVPGDLTLALDADRAHRAGLTGRGVRLAMI